MITYTNPIIPGFYPDPSICRVGDDYYLVNSSFEFFPGVPLWHSKDMIHWRQLGYVLDRRSQLPLEGVRTSGGIYAPTIRFHEGRFYMVTTNVSFGGNFYVWTDDISGSWSDPIYVKQGGIDPSLFWEDGTVYFMSTYQDEQGKSCIGQCTMDIETGEQLTPTRPIWYGTGGKCPEGPHMYKKDGFYYLMIAEGGTEYGHMETIARSTSPWGPFEGCPHNPILTHRNRGSGAEVEFHGLGHADIVEDQAGQWWIVFHAIRPSQFMLHHVGRETMLAPVTWEDGWPIVAEGKYIENPMTVSDIQGYNTAKQYESWKDCFEGTKFANRWSFLRNPHMQSYCLDADSVKLTGVADTLDGRGSPTALLTRQQQMKMTAQVKLLAAELSENSAVGLTIFHTCEHHYDLVVAKQGDDNVAFLRKRVGDILTTGEAAKVTLDKPLILRVVADRLEYQFYVGASDDQMICLGSGRTQLLSTECMICTFTGCFEGIFAEGEASARFSEFSCDFT